MSNHPFVVGEADPVFRLLRTPRTWRRILAGSLAGMAAGGLWVLATPPSYEASVALELSEVAPVVDISPLGPRGDRLTIDTDAQLLRSDGVVRAVAAANGASPAQVLESLSVSARPLTRVMVISYTADSGEEALRSVEAATEAFLSERDRLVISPVRDYLVYVTERGIRGSDTLVETEDTESDEQTSENRRRLALAKLLSLPGPGTVLEGARITAEADRGDIEVPLATGAAVGALAGVLLGLVDDRRRRSVASRPVAPTTAVAP